MGDKEAAEEGEYDRWFWQIVAVDIVLGIKDVFAHLTMSSIWTL